jgi:hypothetical protein
MNRQRSGLWGWMVVLTCTLATLGAAFSPQQVQASWWMAPGAARPMYPPVPVRGTQHPVLLKPAPYVGEVAPNAPVAGSSASAMGVVAKWMPFTSNSRLAMALTHLAESAEGRASLALIQRYHGKVLFKSLAELNPQYTDFDALAWMDAEGNWMLFINEKHQHAPTHALAALIAHEAMHGDAYNSRQEEAEAWSR